MEKQDTKNHTSAPTAVNSTTREHSSPSSSIDKTPKQSIKPAVTRPNYMLRLL